MTLQWLLYCAALGALLALAAAALEGGARALRLPTRWGWAAALTLTLTLPLAAWLRPSAEAAPAIAVDGAPVDVLRLPVLPLAGSAEAAATALPWLAAERGLAAGWGLASAAVLLWIVAMSALLAYRRRRWTRASAAGVPVLFAPDTGPAVVGLLRGRIVLPAWAREAEPRVLETMVAHEREHLRAGDHRLLTLGLLVAAAMPWHPAAWWMLRRLRLAVEVDCDARVIRRRADVHAYGRVLLEVGQRAGRLPLGAAALSQPVSFLERRIRIMTSPRVRFPRLRAAALATVASGLMLAACEMATPSGPTPADARRVYAADGSAEGLQPAELTPRGAVERYYPDVLAAGAGENTVLLFVVSADGRIVEHRRSTVEPGAAAPARIRSRSGGAVALESFGGLDVAPESVHTIDILKLASGRMGPDPVSIVWIRQGEAGALVVVPTRAPHAQATADADTPRPARVTVAGGERTMELRPLTPAEPRSNTDAPQTITVLPTRADGLPSPASEARTLTLRPTRMVDGVGPDVLVVITDAAGNEVHRGTMPPASELNPDMIATIDVRKGAGTSSPSGEIHIRLKD
jgi:hypothetical protein